MENLPTINSQAIEVCQTLNQAGYQAYIVGGCVRDMLLNSPPKDWDITTDAKPEQVISLFLKTIPTGLKHGTVTVVMGEKVENHFEVTTFRIEGEYKDGRRPEEVFFVPNVEQDLARRDLTINAIALDPLTGKMIDPYHGVEDLHNRVIRAVGDANARFQEDGLRIMRVARFAARFNYDVDEITLQGMKNNLDILSKVSKERISDELCKTLMTENPAYGFRLLNKSGALKVTCPLLTSELPLLRFLLLLDNCKGEMETRLAFLYGNCKTLLVQKELTELKLSNKEINRVIFLLELLDKYMELSKRNTVALYSDFIAFIKNKTVDNYDYTLEQFLLLTEAMGFSSREQLAKHVNVVVFARKELQINGDNLLQMGVKPGPKFKEILDECYTEILRYPEHNTLEFLTEFVSKI